jgi:hypothetical protein
MRKLPLIGKRFLERTPGEFYEYAKTLSTPQKTEVKIKTRTRKKRDEEIHSEAGNRIGPKTTESLDQ